MRIELDDAFVFEVADFEIQAPAVAVKLDWLVSRELSNSVYGR